MPSTFSLTVEPAALTRVRASLRDFLRADERIRAWWNHLPGLYLITFEGTTVELSHAVAPLVKPSSFLVMKVEPEEAQGWLPEGAWGWLDRHHA